MRVLRYFVGKNRVYFHFDLGQDCAECCARLVRLGVSFTFGKSKVVVIAKKNFEKLRGEDAEYFQTLINRSRLVITNSEKRTGRRRLLTAHQMASTHQTIAEKWKNKALNLVC